MYFWRRASKGFYCVHTVFAALTNFSSYLYSTHPCKAVLKKETKLYISEGTGRSERKGPRTGISLRLLVISITLETDLTICWLTLTDVTLFLILRLTSKAEKQTVCWQQGNMKKQFLVTKKLLVSRNFSHSNF